MSGPLVVDVNAGELHRVEPVVEAFEPSGSFEVASRKHGRPVQVHPRPEAGLERVAAPATNDPWFEGEATTTVPVGVPEDAPPAEGRLAVGAGYGSDEAAVRVQLAAGASGDPAAADRGDHGPPSPGRADGPAGGDDRDGVAEDGTPGSGTSAAPDRLGAAVELVGAGAGLLAAATVGALALAGNRLLAAAGAVVLAVLLALALGIWRS